MLFDVNVIFAPLYEAKFDVPAVKSVYVAIPLVLLVSLNVPPKAQLPLCALLTDAVTTDPLTTLLYLSFNITTGWVLNASPFILGAPGSVF